MAHPGDRDRWSDQQLLDGIAARDSDAFRVFYRRLVLLVMEFLLRKTGDREVAADLAAEVCAAVMIAASRYQRQGESAVPWWLGSLATSWGRAGGLVVSMTRPDAALGLSSRSSLTTLTSSGFTGYRGRRGGEVAERR